MIYKTWHGNVSEIPSSFGWAEPCTRPSAAAVQRWIFDLKSQKGFSRQLSEEIWDSKYRYVRRIRRRQSIDSGHLEPRRGCARRRRDPRSSTLAGAIYGGARGIQVSASRKDPRRHRLEWYRAGIRVRWAALRGSASSVLAPPGNSNEVAFFVVMYVELSVPCSLESLCNAARQMNVRRQDA